MDSLLLLIPLHNDMLELFSLSRINKTRPLSVTFQQFSVVYFDQLMSASHTVCSQNKFLGILTLFSFKKLLVKQVGFCLFFSRDSPTIIVFSTSIVFYWKRSSSKIR